MKFRSLPNTSFPNFVKTSQVIPQTSFPNFAKTSLSVRHQKPLPTQPTQTYTQSLVPQEAPVQPESLAPVAEPEAEPAPAKPAPFLAIAKALPQKTLAAAPLYAGIAGALPKHFEPKPVNSVITNLNKMLA